MKIRQSPLLATLAALAIVLGAVWVIDRSEQERFRFKSRSDVLQVVGAARAQLETALNRRLFLARGLVAHVATHRGIDDDEFQILAKLLVGQQTGIRSLQLAKNSVVSHIYPLRGNAAAMGHDLLRSPDRRATVARAIETRRFVVGGPFQLLQGGSAVIGHIPIFLAPPASGSGGREYWGLAMVAIDLDGLLAEAGLPDAAVSFALRETKAGRPFFGDAAVFRSDPVISEVTFPNGSWQLAAIPAGGWPVRAPGTWKWRTGGSLLAILAGLLVWLKAREPAQLRRAVEQATRALRHSEERFRTLASVSPVGMFHTDALGRWLYVNQRGCEISGLDAEQAYGDRWTQALHPDDRDEVVAKWQKAIHEDLPFKAEFRFRHGGGQMIWVLGQSAPEKTRSGETIGHVGTITDITDRKLAEEQERQHQAELAHVARLGTVGEMASGLAHELNQPLSAIVNYARGAAIRMRQSDAINREEMISAMEQISALAVRGGDIIRSLRNLVRKKEPKREPVNLNDLVREVAAFMQGEARRHRIRVHLELAESLPAVEADAVQIEQVMLNLVRNSFEAMSDDGISKRELTIETRQDGPDVAQVRVRDTGKGLSSDVLDRAFDPFFTTKPAGMGMGLSISRSIVEAHGGRLWATANAERGATFHFTLPTV